MGFLLCLRCLELLLGLLSAVTSKFKVTPRLCVSTFVTFTHANSLIVVAVLPDGHKRFWGHRDHRNDLLVSLSQEDRAREVGFDLYMPDT